MNVRTFCQGGLDPVSPHVDQLLGGFYWLKFTFGGFFLGLTM